MDGQIDRWDRFWPQVQDRPWGDRSQTPSYLQEAEGPAHSMNGQVHCGRSGQEGGGREEKGPLQGGSQAAGPWEKRGNQWSRPARGLRQTRPTVHPQARTRKSLSLTEAERGQDGGPCC